MSKISYKLFSHFQTAYTNELILFLLIQLSFILLASLELWAPLIIIIIIPTIYLAIFNPKTLIYFVIASLFIGFYIIEEPIGIKLVDICIILAFLGFIIRKIINNDEPIPKTMMDKSILLLLLCLFVSLLDIFSFSHGIINYFRHLELFIIFYLFVAGICSLGKSSIMKLLNYYLLFALIASSIAIVMLFFNGEGRAFGVTGVALSDLIVSALIISISQLFLRSSKLQWFIYSFITYVLFIQIILLQTRGAWLSVVLSCMFLLVLIRMLSYEYFTRNLLWVFLLASLSMFTSSQIFSNVFIGLVHRAEHLVQLQIGTLHYRLILWEAAYNAFIEHYLNGLGLGQFPINAGNYSSIGISSFFIENIKGLTAHNVILSYLAETGIVGIIGLIFFFSTCLRVGLYIYQKSSNIKEYQETVPLFTMLFFVFVSSFYAGSWFWSINGVQFMFFLALTNVMYKCQMQKT